MTERTIAVDYLARVEGEGALKVRLDGPTVQAVELRLFEPPRFFEALLRGRSYAEAPDLTARICGICPVAYQMSSAHAIERALGLSVPAPIRDLRRVLYCGEWIESHALHIYLLHAPDFLGYPDALRLARDRPEVVRRGLALKKAGNEVLSVLGGREIHPVNVRIGGFYRLPTAEELDGLRSTLRAALALAEETVRWVAGFEFPAAEEPYEFVALRHPSDYPMNEGRIVSSEGLLADPWEFDTVFEERQVPYSTALHCRRRGGGTYLVGPLARYNLNADHLTPRARAAAAAAGLGREERNPYRSIVVRAVEVLFACEEALRLLSAYRPPDRPFVEPPLDFAGGTGAWVTEAPRGILAHAYRLAPDGSIADARIVPPTSQNQARIEEDLCHVVTRLVDRSDAELADACERSIRNYDPCISCSTHFLKLEVDRR